MSITNVITDWRKLLRNTVERGLINATLVGTTPEWREREVLR